MSNAIAYNEFISDLTVFCKENEQLLSTTFGNIFSWLKYSNKMHGDMSELLMTFLINEFMTDKYSAIHVGKTRVRTGEEDVSVLNHQTGETFDISLKAYGAKYRLQVFTDKENVLYDFVRTADNKLKVLIDSKEELDAAIKNNVFRLFTDSNLLAFIYNSKNSVFDILLFDGESLLRDLRKMELYHMSQTGTREIKSPHYNFYDENGSYLCHYYSRGKAQNAITRGVWVEYKGNAMKYWRSILPYPFKYHQNNVNVKLSSLIHTLPEDFQNLIFDMVMKNHPYTKDV